MTLLKAENLGYAFPGKTLFKHFSITVKRGEWVTFIGNNGTGKTTLLKVLAGVLPIQEGSLFIGVQETGVALKAIERA